MISIIASKYGLSTTHFDDPQMQTVDQTRVINGRAVQ